MIRLGAIAVSFCGVFVILKVVGGFEEGLALVESGIGRLTK